jgi:hypothetical protein
LNICLKGLFTEGDCQPFLQDKMLNLDIRWNLTQLSEIKSLFAVQRDLFQLYSCLCLKTGFPLLGLFNVVIGRCMQSGLVDKYWSELNFVRQLKRDWKPEENYWEVCDDKYFVFSLSRLTSAFVILGFRYLLCVLVFIVELFCKWHWNTEGCVVTIYCLDHWADCLVEFNI